jgi:hypothetical protein
MQGKGGRGGGGGKGGGGGGGGGGGRGRKRNKNRKRDRRLGEIKYDAEGKMIDDRNTEAGKLLGYKVGTNGSKASLSLAIIVLSSVVDPDPGYGVAFLTLGHGKGEKSRSGYGMNIPDHMSESLQFFVLNILKFFDSDPGSGIFDPGSGMKKFGSGINTTDLQHWFLECWFF